jgi:hypothetical protein
MSVDVRPAVRPRIPTTEIETLLQLSRCGGERSRVVLALVRRIVEIQDSVSETEIVQLVEEVGALLRGEVATH